MDYQRAFNDYIKGSLQNSPLHAFLPPLSFVMNFVVPAVFAFLTYKMEPIIAMCCFLVAFAVAMVITAWEKGYTRLTGINNLVWLPMIYYFWPSLSVYPIPKVWWTTHGIFALWLRIVIAIDVISVAVGLFEVTRYLMGDRKNLIQPAKEKGGVQIPVDVKEKTT